MHKLLPALVTIVIIVISSCSAPIPENFVLVKPPHLPDFYIDQYEVTQRAWKAVLFNNPSTFKGDELPVETVSWYDCIVYCNKRSLRENLLPYYTIDSSTKDAGNSNEIDTVKWIVTINAAANGYRLPTATEWEYAAHGGQASQHYTYSGSNNIDDVAWYWKNSGNKYLTGNWSWPLLQQNGNQTKPVGKKQPNELGLYDMSGNVREWCWNWQGHDSTGNAPGRMWKGGGWMGAEFCCEPVFSAAYEANGKGPDQGFRVCRSRK